MNQSTKKLTCFTLLLFSFSALKASAATPTPSKPLQKETQIEVKLLGEPCLLRGPVDKEMLQKIHALGPAQVYPNLSPLPTELSRSIKSIEKTSDFIKNFKNPSQPSSAEAFFDGYRQQLTKRLESQSDFLRGLEKFQKTNTVTDLIEAGKSNVKQSYLKEYEDLIQRLPKEKTKPSVSYNGFLANLFDSYNEWILPDPQKEYHKATMQIGITYECALDELTPVKGEEE